MERVAQFYALAHHVSLLLRLSVPAVALELPTSTYHLALAARHSTLNPQPSVPCSVLSALPFLLLASIVLI